MMLENICHHISEKKKKKYVKEFSPVLRLARALTYKFSPQELSGKFSQV